MTNDSFWPITLELRMVPCSLNRLLRSHWSFKQQQLTAWHTILYVALDATKIQEKKALMAKAQLATRMRLDIEVHHSRLFDHDNLVGSVKPLVDAVKHLGLIYDDRPAFLELKVTQKKSTRKNQHTVIILRPKRGSA